jgi:hypothetical protein
VIGEPCIAWVPSSAVRVEGPYDRLAVVTDKKSFSGANRQRASTLRTLSLVRECLELPDGVTHAALLAGLVGVRNLKTSLAPRVRVCEFEICAALGYESPQDIWARSNAAPLPIRPPESMLDPGILSDGVALGQLLRKWHEMIFARHVAVRAVPVRGGVGALTLDQYNAVTGVLTRGLNDAPGSSAWKKLEPVDLEALVWEKPRIQLRHTYGVSDVAIAKRCERLGITVPPRGYWQRLEAMQDPRDLLDKNGVGPPAHVSEFLSRKFDEVFA